VSDKLSVTVETTVDYKRIRVPNYIIIDDGKVGRRQGMREAPTKAVEDLTQAEAKALSHAFVKDFMAKAGYPQR